MNFTQLILIKYLLRSNPAALADAFIGLQAASDSRLNLSTGLERTIGILQDGQSGLIDDGD